MQFFLIALPVVIVVLLLVSGWAMGALSGWYGLMRLYPDRGETPTRVFSGQTGSMNGGLSFNGILSFSVCPSGLRVSAPRVFAPFSKPYFVPWPEIRVYRLSHNLLPTARLDFGQPSKGMLNITASAADRLGRAAGANWPEPGPFPVETTSRILAGIVLQWAALSALLAILLVMVSLLYAPATPWLPLPICIGLPALAMGLFACVQFNLQANAADAERKLAQASTGG